MPSTRTPCGITITSSVEDGTWRYSRGGRIIAISTAERWEFLAKFGFTEGAPENFDTITFSERDYRALTQREPREVPFQ